MPSVAKTPNLALTQYADNGTDRISMMSDYNHDMITIDRRFKAMSDRIAQLEAQLQLKNMN